jgi:hypothetical protein
MSGLERWELVRVDKEMVERLLAEEPSRVMLVGLERQDDGTVDLIFRTPDDQGTVEEVERLRDELEDTRGAVDLVERARGCVTAALNCTAHPWHGDDRARKWLMDADRLGGQ